MFTKSFASAIVAVCALVAHVVYVQFGPPAAARGMTTASASPQTSPWAVQSVKGSIVLAGGTFIDEVGAEVVRLAGGKQAHLVLIPTAYGPTEEEGVEQFHTLWSKWSPAKITILHTRDKAVADDPDFVKPLLSATGVWFLGGVQTRLLDTYGGTLLQREVQGVFDRGGVVGGNCAGAMALGETMIVRGESDEEVILRPGLGIVPKMVADSHWLERNRIERLRGVIQEHPDHFGLGIDGETAVVITGGELRCIGKSYAATIVPVASPQAVRFDVWAQGDKVALSELFAVP